MVFQPAADPIQNHAIGIVHHPITACRDAATDLNDDGLRGVGADGVDAVILCHDVALDNNLMRAAERDHRIAVQRRDRDAGADVQIIVSRQDINMAKGGLGGGFDQHGLLAIQVINRSFCYHDFATMSPRLCCNLAGAFPLQKL
ncbi:MAG: hypothetical protein ACD_54C00615G0001 [uncultured bacterium]|nr:MAG: hypothetical protein ACD_54C00615G0001 [uncultured bacterium]